jgi:Ion channel
MRIGRQLPASLEAARPGWLTAGAIRLGVLCVFIVAIEMLRPRLSPHSAGLVATAGAIAVAIGAALFVGAARRLAEHLPFFSRSQRITDAAILQLRRIGLPLLGLLFFLFWTFVYLALWAFHPGESFRGLEPDPRFADFFYYAVSTALISPPGDILAHSRGARAATMIEMLTGFGVLTAYLSSFVDFGGQHDETPHQADGDAS